MSGLREIRGDAVGLYTWNYLDFVVEMGKALSTRLKRTIKSINCSAFSCSYSLFVSKLSITEASTVV